MKHILALFLLVILGFGVANGAIQTVTYNTATGQIVSPSTGTLIFPGGVTATNIGQLSQPILAHSYLYTPDSTGTNFATTNDGRYWTNLPTTYLFSTNGFTGTIFQLQTNSVYVGSTLAGFTDVANVSTVGGTWGEMTIIATGNLTITNPVSWHTSDLTNSRSITTGQSLGISVEVLAGLRTNVAIVVFP